MMLMGVLKMAKRSSTAIATEREGLMECHDKEEGWMTTRTTKKRQWSKGKDYFGIGDILSYRYGITKLTDVSTNAQKGKIEIMKQWMLDNQKHIPKDLECEVAVWKSKSKVKSERFLITNIKQDGTTTKREIIVKPEWYGVLKEMNK